MNNVPGPWELIIILGGLAFMLGVVYTIIKMSTIKMSTIKMSTPSTPKHCNVWQ